MPFNTFFFFFAVTLLCKKVTILKYFLLYSKNYVTILLVCTLIFECIFFMLNPTMSMESIFLVILVKMLEKFCLYVVYTWHPRDGFNTSTWNRVESACQHATLHVLRCICLFAFSCCCCFVLFYLFFFFVVVFGFCFVLFCFLMSLIN